MKEIYSKIINFKKLENQYDFKDESWWYKIPANCRVLYNESRIAYVSGLYFSSILTIAAAIEVFFVFVFDFFCIKFECSLPSVSTHNSSSSLVKIS